LSVGNVTFESGSTFAVVLNGTTAGLVYDQRSSTGTVNLNGATLTVGLTGTVGAGSPLTIIQATTALRGTFKNLGATITVGSEVFTVRYGSTDFVLTR
jgi:hypothetical protein